MEKESELPRLGPNQTVSKFQCPLCKSKLVSEPGNHINPELGVTLFCVSGACPAQEVMGYGKDDAAAFKIITERFSFALRSLA